MGRPAGWMKELTGRDPVAVFREAWDRGAGGSGGVLVGDRGRVHVDGGGRVGGGVGTSGRPVVPGRVTSRSVV